MILNYQTTFDEYSEASKAVGARTAKKRKKSGRQQWFMVFAAAYFVAAVWIWDWLLPSQPFTVLFHLYAPFALRSIGMLIIVGAMTLLTGTLPRPSHRSILRLWSPLVTLGILALYFFLQRMSFTGRSLGKWDWSLLLPHTTWTAIYLYVAAVTTWTNRKRVENVWNEVPGLARAKTADITADGVVIKDDVSEVRYFWNAFVDFEETPNLFLLLTSAKTMVCIPKRAFADDVELNAMRALSDLMPRSDHRAFPLEPTSAPNTPPPPLPTGGA